MNAYIQLHDIPPSHPGEPKPEPVTPDGHPPKPIYDPERPEHPVPLREPPLTRPPVTARPR